VTVHGHDAHAILLLTTQRRQVEQLDAEHPLHPPEPAVIGFSTAPWTPKDDICLIRFFDRHDGHPNSSSSRLLRIKSSKSSPQFRHRYS
jgi:hypothetical protein